MSLLGKQKTTIKNENSGITPNTSNIANIYLKGSSFAQSDNTNNMIVTHKFADKYATGTWSCTSYTSWNSLHN